MEGKSLTVDHQRGCWRATLESSECFFTTIANNQIPSSDVTMRFGTKEIEKMMAVAPGWLESHSLITTNHRSPVYNTKRQSAVFETYKSRSVGAAVVPSSHYGCSWKWSCFRKFVVRSKAHIGSIKIIQVPFLFILLWSLLEKPPSDFITFL